MIKVGDYLYNGKSFVKVLERVKRKRSLYDVEIISTKVNFVTQVGKTACITEKEAKSYKNLGSNKEVIDNLYPDYYNLWQVDPLLWLQAGNQMGKTNMIFMSPRQYSVLKNILGTI